MNSLGYTLKNLRKKRNLSQTELSKALGISFSAISMYERGSRNPDIDMLVRLAEFFDVSTDYLLSRVNHLPISSTSTLSQNVTENTVHLTRRTGVKKIYTLSDRQTDVIEGMLDEMTPTSPYGEIAAQEPAFPGSLVAHEGESNKSGRKRLKPTIKDL